MEKVFWLMYLADVVGNISVLAGTALAITLMGAVFLALNIAFDEPCAYTKYAKCFRWVAIPVALAVLLPAPTTLRLLAVGAASEAATSTQLGQKGLEALNAVLDQVITKAKKDVSK